MLLNRPEDFLLARFFGDVERDEAATGEPDVRNDRAVRVVVKVKKGTRPTLERAGSPLTQFAERAKFVQETGEPLEPSLATKSRRCLELGHAATPPGAIG
jgi:hypothetical protein